MRIAYLNPCGKFGGAETSLREILASIRNAEPDLELWLVLGEDGPLAEVARDLKVRVVIQAFPSALARIGEMPGAGLAARSQMLLAVPGTAGYAWRLAATLRRIQPDIIHTNGLKMHLLAAWSRPRESRLVWHIHDYVSTRPLMSRLLRPFRTSCDLAIANSYSVAKDVAATLPGMKVAPVYNAVDVQRFCPSGAQLDLDALAGLPPAAPRTIRVGLLATFARWKGHRIFLEALSRLSADAPVRGYIIGGPIYQTLGSQWSLQELQQEAECLGLAGKVGFTGFLDDTAAALRTLDVVVHASTQPEPFGMVIIEAMACGKALIAAQAGGASELFVDGENALAHAPGDSVALSQQISRLVSNGEAQGEAWRSGETNGLAALRRSSTGQGVADAVSRNQRQGWSGETQGVCAVAYAARTMRTSMAQSVNLRSQETHARSSIAESGAARVRVLHLNAGNLYGGVETFLTTLARLRDLCSGMEPHFASCYEGRWSREVQAAGAPVYNLGHVRLSRPWTVWRARRRLKKILSTERIGVVVCHMPWSLVVFGSVARAAGSRVIFYVHGFQNQRSVVDRLARRRVPDLAISNSQSTGKTVADLYPNAPVRTLYVQWRLPRLPRAEPIRRELLFDENSALATIRYVIIQVSRMERWKGHLLHLEALSRMKGHGSWVCWMVGGAQKQEEEEYLNFCENGSTTQHRRPVQFLGQRSDVPRLLAAADIFCQPNEGPEPSAFVCRGLMGRSAGGDHSHGWGTGDH